MKTKTFEWISVLSKAAQGAMQKPKFETYAGTAVPTYVAHPGDESGIGQIDLWRVICTRWRWLLTGILLGAVIALAFALFAVPTYESRASFQIGKIHGWGVVEEPDLAIAKLMEKYGVAAGVQAQQPEVAHLKQVTKSTGQHSVLRLVAVGASPEEARDFLTKIIADLTQRHDQIYEVAAGPVRRRLAAVDVQIGFVSTQVAAVEKLIPRVNKSNPVQASLLLIEQGRLRAELNLLERDRVELEQQTQQPFSGPSQAVALPDIGSVKTVVLKKSTAAVIGLVLGFALAMVVVLFLELFKNLRTASKLYA